LKNIVLGEAPNTTREGACAPHSKHVRRSTICAKFAPLLNMIVRFNIAAATGASLLAVLLLLGCSSTSKTAKVQKTPAAKGDPSPAVGPVYPEISDEALSSYAHYATGLSLDMRDDSAAALDEFVKAANANPTEEALVMEVAKRLLRGKQQDRAIELLARSAGQPSSSGLVHSWLGMAYAAAGETNKAIASNRTAIQKMPNQIIAYANLCELYLQVKKTNEVISVLDEAGRQKDAPPEFYVNLAEVILRMQAKDVLGPDDSKKRAVAALDKAAALKPEDPVILQKMGDAYLFRGEAQKAEAVLAKLYEAQPDIPGLREKLINVYFRTNKDKAAAMLQELKKDAPTDPRPHMLLGQMAVDEERYAEGLEHFQTALLLDPNVESLYYRIAALQVSMKKPQEALTTLEKSKARFKKLTFLHEFYSGIAKSAMEKYSEALSDFTSAELLAKNGDPERLNASFYFQLGSTSERAKDIEQAVKYFKRALELQPDFSEALNYLGYMWAERGENLDEAHSMIERALKEEPKNAAFLDSMAWVLFKLKRPGEALSYMQKAIELTKEPDATLFDHLGDIYAAMNRRTEAREAWEKALKIDPKDEIRKKLETSG
jgi:tetratricopeptide (TPR) repeat protein